MARSAPPLLKAFPGHFLLFSFAFASGVDLEGGGAVAGSSVAEDFASEGLGLVWLGSGLGLAGGLGGRD